MIKSAAAIKADVIRGIYFAKYKNPKIKMVKSWKEIKTKRGQNEAEIN